jgi:CO/xanthine dehydrogenase Mo-binding subunit
MVRNDGRITAAQAYLAYEAGAYPGSMVVPGGMCIFAAYDIANVHIDCYDVVVNKPSTAAYRAPGATNAAFATETVVDEIAEKLAIDPIEIRLRNAAKEGTRRADGPKYRRVGCVEVLETIKRHPHYNAPLEGPNRGRGVAMGFWFNIGFASSCNISVNADGTVNLVEGSTDIGGTRTSIAMQAAEVLGIAAEDVNPSVADTDSIGYTAVTGGSRTTSPQAGPRGGGAGRVRQPANAPPNCGGRRRFASAEAGVFRPANTSLSFRELGRASR